MTKSEVESILAKLLDVEDAQLDAPTDREWEDMTNKFNCDFSDEFKYFIELMSKYSFPGDIYNVSKGKTNGNDNIQFVYDYEMKKGLWYPNLIPFYGIGNGDYFCLKTEECPDSKVYYFYHEDSRVEAYSDNFEEWIKQLKSFLE